MIAHLTPFTAGAHVDTRRWLFFIARIQASDSN